ncbi:MAG: hypothetical protein Q9214_003949, partial [Letrouitia sp. 1 TL-2023]
MGPTTSSQELLYQAVEMEQMKKEEGNGGSTGIPSQTSRRRLEYRRISVRKDRQKSMSSAVVLLIPVGISFGILQLTFRNLYWRDAQKPGTSEQLGLMQVAAKAHEILIVYSLSQLVLHYLRVLLGSVSGMPFGLFASGYSHTLGQLPLAPDFWQSFVSAFRTRHIRWRTISFTMLVLLSTLIGLTAGPASAITLIPQLRWWRWSDLFYFQPHAVRNTCFHDEQFSPDFSLYMPKPLFPSEVNASSLPDSGCSNDGFSVNSSCPYRGLDTLIRSFNWTGTNNFTIETLVGRFIATHQSSEPQNYEWLNPWISSWTTSQVMTELISQGVVFSSIEESLIAIEARQSQSRTVPSPVVNVSCEVRPSKDFSRNLTFLIDPQYLARGSAGGSFSSQENEHLLNGIFDLREIWDEDTLKDPPSAKLDFKEFIDTDGNVILSAFILMPKDSYGPANVSMCSVYARWVPSELFLLPSQSSNVVSNFTFDNYLNDAYDPHHGELNYPPTIPVRKPWADGLNALNHTTNTTVLASFVNASMSSYRINIPHDGAGFPGFGHALMLSTAITNGLAAIGLEFAHNITACRKGWCSQGPFYTRNSGYIIFNGTEAEGFEACSYSQSLSTYPAKDLEGADQLLQSFREPSQREKERQQWTRVSFPVFKYGYGWSFDPVTVRVAAAVLVLHAVVVIMHVAYVLFSGRAYTYAGSLGELLALALESRPPPAEVFRPPMSSSARKTGEGKVWNRRTA